MKTLKVLFLLVVAIPFTGCVIMRTEVQSRPRFAITRKTPVEPITEEMVSACVLNDSSKPADLKTIMAAVNKVSDLYAAVGKKIYVTKYSEATVNIDLSEPDQNAALAKVCTECKLKMIFSNARKT